MSLIICKWKVKQVKMKRQKKSDEEIKKEKDHKI